MLGADIGIDVGTANTTISLNKSIVLRESSVVAIESDSGRPIAFGKAAEKMIGRTHDGILPVRPILRGFVAEYEVTRLMLRQYLKQVYGNRIFKPRVMVSVPAGITAIQKRTFHKLITSAGARKVCLIETPVAAAIGAGVDFSRPHGAIVVDIGAGTTDVAVITLGGLSVWDTLNIASQDIDEAIIRYVRREHNVLIGNVTAENIKKEIGGALPRPIEVAFTAKGRNLFSGMPQVFEVTSTELFEVIAEPLEQIYSGIQAVLERTPPELLSDIYTDGIILTGKGSLLYGLKESLSKRLHAPARIVAEPDSCVAKGTSIALKNLSLLKNCDYKFQTLQDLVVDY